MHDKHREGYTGGKNILYTCTTSTEKVILEDRTLCRQAQAQRRLYWRTEHYVDMYDKHREGYTGGQNIL